MSRAGIKTGRLRAENRKIRRQVKRTVEQGEHTNSEFSLMSLAVQSILSANPHKTLAILNDTVNSV